MLRKGVFCIVCCLCGFSVFAQTCPLGSIERDVPSTEVIASGECPVGYTSYAEVDECKSDSVGLCWLVERLRDLCGAGVSSLKTSGGVSFPLYSDKLTSPSICIKYNDVICYVDLEAGKASGMINVEYNGVVYHAVSD